MQCAVTPGRLKDCCPHCGVLVARNLQQVLGLDERVELEYVLLAVKEWLVGRNQLLDDLLLVHGIVYFVPVWTLHEVVGRCELTSLRIDLVSPCLPYSEAAEQGGIQVDGQQPGNGLGFALQ